MIKIYCLCQFCILLQSACLTSNMAHCHDLSLYSLWKQSFYKHVYSDSNVFCQYYPEVFCGQRWKIKFYSKDLQWRSCYVVHGFRWPATSSPGPSLRSKWRSEKPLAKAAEILQESWSIWSRDTWFPAYGSPVCFLQLETVVQTKWRHFIAFAWRNFNEFFGATFSALARGFSDCHFEWGEGPGDEGGWPVMDNLHFWYARN